MTKAPASMRCEYCAAPLFGRRRRFCGIACNRKHYSTINPRVSPYTDHNDGAICRWCRLPIPPYERKGMGSGPPRVYCGKACLRRCMKDTGRRMERAARRGATVIERVYAMEVFEAAGWHCQGCGCETPRELAGTGAMNSPELDHIIPLSRKGPHTRANVQLLCRACNLRKAMDERLETSEAA